MVKQRNEKCVASLHVHGRNNLSQKTVSDLCKWLSDEKNMLASRRCNVANRYTARFIVTEDEK